MADLKNDSIIFSATRCMVRYAGNDVTLIMELQSDICLVELLRRKGDGLYTHNSENMERSQLDYILGPKMASNQVYIQ